MLGLGVVLGLRTGFMVRACCLLPSPVSRVLGFVLWIPGTVLLEPVLWSRVGSSMVILVMIQFYQGWMWKSLALSGACVP